MRVSVQQVVLGERREFPACDAGVAAVNAAVDQRGDVRVKRRQGRPVTGVLVSAGRVQNEGERGGTGVERCDDEESTP
jgi:hypothetical protein